MKCPKCGFSNPTAAKFCNQCGSALITGQPSAGKGQRRPVAVVFADISGFTALSETLDPEEVKDLIDACLKKLADVIYKYEGYIDKFIGDCIMAIFGAPVAHEDDPLRAVLASIEMLSELEQFNKTTKRSLSLTVGINYGVVATGDLGRPGAYTVMGDAVNLAQRLQSSAPHGKIYASEAIYNNTKNEVEYLRLKKIRVKGKKELVAVFIPQRVRRKFSLRKIQELPLIGRRLELNKLQEIFAKVRLGNSQVVSVIGEAGIGKSKLVYELRKLLGENQHIFESRGIEYLKVSPYFVLKEMLKGIFGIIDNDSPKTASRKVIEFVNRTADRGMMKSIPFFHYLLSLELTRDEYNRLESMNPEDRIRLINEAILSLLIRMAKRKPLIIIFDDCHWVDKETVDFMHRLAKAIEHKPIMLINIYRPEFDTGNLVELIYFTAINLEPLPTTDTVVLLRRLFNCTKIDDRLLRLLIDKSGGLPFYIHELANNLLSSSLVVVESGIAKLKPGKEFVVPRTLDELVMAKIDRLEPALRQAVDIAAVIGDEFSVELLGQLLHQGGKIRAILGPISELGIIQPTTQKGIDERYTFRHSIIKDAVYNSILKKELKKNHLAIAYAMEKVYASNLNEYLDALAEHFLQGGDSGKAVEYLEKAADRKKDLYLNEAAIKMYQQIIELTEESQPEKTALLYEKSGAIYDLIGSYDQAIKAFTAMGRAGLDAPLIRIRSLINVAGVLKNRGQFDRTLDMLNKARGILATTKGFSESEMQLLQSNVLTLECWIYRVKGKIAEAEQKGLGALSMINNVKDWKDYKKLKRAMATANTNLAIVYCVKGDFERAINLCEDTLIIAEELGDERGKGSVYNILGTVYRSQGKYDDAIKAFEMKLKASEELGDKSGMGIAYSNLGNVYQNKGDFITAIELFEKHLHICEELGDKPGIGLASNNLGIIYFNNAEYPRAIKSFEHYLKISEELGDKRGIAIASGNLGEVYESEFEHDKAIELFRKYLKISEELGDKRGMAYASHDLGQAYTETGKLGVALAYLNTAKEFFASIGNKTAVGNIYNAISYLKLKEGRDSEALEIADLAVKLAEETRANDIKLSALLNIGRIFGFKSLKARKTRESASAREAEDYLKKSVESFTVVLALAQNLKNRRLLADAYYEYGKVLKALNKNKDAQSMLKHAFKIYRELNLELRIKNLKS